MSETAIAADVERFDIWLTGSPRVARSPVDTSQQILHKTFAVSSTVKFPFEIPAHAAIPAELEKLFRQDRSLRKFFLALPEALLRHILNQVATPKSPEARRNRAEHWAEAMLLTMEAEITLPPILAQAFAREPLALKRWNTMSTTLRRQLLIGLFHAVSPDTRAARATYIVDKCLPADRRRSSN